MAPSPPDCSRCHDTNCCVALFRSDHSPLTHLLYFNLLSFNLFPVCMYELLANRLICVRDYFDSLLSASIIINRVASSLSLWFPLTKKTIAWLRVHPAIYFIFYVPTTSSILSCGFASTSLPASSIPMHLSPSFNSDWQLVGGVDCTCRKLGPSRCRSCRGTETHRGNV